MTMRFALRSSPLPSLLYPHPVGHARSLSGRLFSDFLLYLFSVSLLAIRVYVYVYTRIERDTRVCSKKREEK